MDGELEQCVKTVLPICGPFLEAGHKPITFGPINKPGAAQQETSSKKAKAAEATAAAAASSSGGRGRGGRGRRG